MVVEFLTQVLQKYIFLDPNIRLIVSFLTVMSAYSHRPFPNKHVAIYNNIKCYSVRFLCPRKKLSRAFKCIWDATYKSK